MPPRTLIGLFLAVFAALALTGPGRIDIIDGQTRYEVARSLIDHGDVVIRDPQVWFPILKGPDGKTYTNYRLPHSALAVPALALADLAGPPSEARRHFYFLLLSAASGALLAVAYAVWFFGHGLSPRAATLWAVGGIFCTPAWFYSTSTFDDIFGATSIVLALTFAWQSRERDSLVLALLAGLAIGAAFNWKQPLAIFVIPTIGAAIIPNVGSRKWARLITIGLGVAVGLVVYQLYEWHRFPPGYERPAVRWNPPIWNETPLVAASALLISPVCGAIWYCPPAVLAFAGLIRLLRNDKVWAASVLVACAGYFTFFCTLRFFKGDIAWGPRYLTPVFAVLWLFMPMAAAQFGKLRTGIVLVLGAMVQLLSLAADPHRVYIVADLPPHILLFANSEYYDLRASHLLMRPSEIWDVLNSDTQPSEASPAPTPTFALPLPDTNLVHHDVARRYAVFSCFRPWWCWQRHIDAAERPVDLARTAALLLVIGGCGAALTVLSLRATARETT